MWLQKFQDLLLKKFSTSEAILGTSMKSVGEAMAIGRNFKESYKRPWYLLKLVYLV